MARGPCPRSQRRPATVQPTDRPRSRSRAAPLPPDRAPAPPRDPRSAAPPGTVLPGIRAFARELGVAAITVMTAYDQLTAEGYLEPQPGRGTLVAPDIPATGGDRGWSRALRPGPVRRRRPLPTLDRGRPDRPFFEHGWPPVRYDFRTGSTRLDVFPVRTWERMLQAAWRDLASGGGRGATDYTQPGRRRPAPPRARGVSRPVAGGPGRAGAGRDHVRRAGRDGDRRPAVARRRAARSRSRIPAARTSSGRSPGLGIPLVHVPVDDRGLPVDRLPDGVSGVLVTPSWQYPRGGTMPIARRLQLLDWAAAPPRGHHRGRLRQRAALRGPPPALAPGPRRRRARPLRGDLQQGALPGAPDGLRGRPGSGRPAVRRPARGGLPRARARSSSGRSRCSSPRASSSAISAGSGRPSPSASRRSITPSPRSSVGSSARRGRPAGPISSSGSRTGG